MNHEPQLIKHLEHMVFDTEGNMQGPDYLVPCGPPVRIDVPMTVMKKHDLATLIIERNQMFSITNEEAKMELKLAVKYVHIKAPESAIAYAFAVIGPGTVAEFITVGLMPGETTHTFKNTRHPHISYVVQYFKNKHHKQQ